MEKRSVDPKTPIDNPENPRSSAPNVAEDRRLALNIKAVGLLHPPVVREREDGALVIVAGHRRRRAAILAGLKKIDVLVREGDEKLDYIAAASENIIRQNMSEPETWRSVLKMRRDGHKEKFICQTLMLRPNELRGLEKLALLHPPILALIERGDGPASRERNIIARASLEDQANAWLECWGECAFENADEGDGAQDVDASLYVPGPDDVDDSFWRDFARALQFTVYYARDAAFDDSIAKAHGIIWEEDLFAQADEDSRSTTDAGAYRAAQMAWLDQNPPENTDIFELEEHGGPALPEGGYLIPEWQGWRNGSERKACWVDGRSLKIREQEYNVREIRHSVGGDTDPGTSGNEAEPAPKQRADISSTGLELIGDIRTTALHAALDAVREDVDPWDLVAGLLLTMMGDNVKINGDMSGDGWRKPTACKVAGAALFPDGLLVREPALLREHALAVMKSAANCGVSMHSGSGLPARVLGLLFDADRHMPNMAFEDFLKTFSKPGLTKAVQAEGLQPKGTGKDMRAALMAQVGEGRWVPDAAGFAQAIQPWSVAVARVRKQMAEAADADGDDDDSGDVAEHDDDAMDGEGEALSPPDPSQFLTDHLEIVVVR